MSVGAAVHPLGLAGGDRRRQDLVAGAASHKRARQMVLPTIARGERTSQADGDTVLPEARHVAHLLGVGAEPEVADADVGVEDVSGLDHTRSAAERIADATLQPLALGVNGGLEPGIELQIVKTLADVPLDVVGRRHAGR